MSTEEFQGVAHAFKTLMTAAKKDIEQGGEIKPVRVLFATSTGRERITWHARAKALRARVRRS